MPKILRHVIQALDTEHQEAVGRDIGVTIEKSEIGAFAHGVQAQQQIPQHLRWVQGERLLIIVLIRPLDQIIEIRHHRIVHSSKL